MVPITLPYWGCDGIVTVADFGPLLAQLERSQPGPSSLFCAGLDAGAGTDHNCDGFVDSADFSASLGQFGGSLE
jgi:hypothetical protein